MARRLFMLIPLMCMAFNAGATEISIPAGDGALLAALKTAKAGDILRLQPGTHRGPININIPLTLAGEGFAKIQGDETGSVISVSATDVTVRGLTITGSGSSGKTKDAGIALGKTAHRALVENNRIIGNLIGVDVRGTHDALISKNLIEGRQGHRMNDRGNGVYVWNAPGSKVIGNDFRWGRDGIFVNTSRNNEFSRNRFRDLRFAIHYMYANNSIVSGNISLGNHLGYAVMYSKNVKITGNFSSGDRNHGIMMNYTNNSQIIDNWIENVGDKCTFIYNAHKNVLRGNIFKECNIGIHFTAGSERNEIAKNAFIGNRTQVKYVGSRWVNWSADEQGNYWSDHTAFDIDGDGIADSVYRPNDIMDHVLWTQPAAKSLLGSPVVQLIRWSQSTFPAMLPGGVVDKFPLMQPIKPQLANWEELK